MNKVVGVLVIGLGIILIVIGIKGTQTQILNDIKAVNPRLRKLTGTAGNVSKPPKKPGPGTGGTGNPGGTIT